MCSFIKSFNPSLPTALNFLLFQISVAAGVYGFYPGVAFCVGLIGAFSYVLWVQIAKRFIDDPLKAFAGN